MKKPTINIEYWEKTRTPEEYKKEIRKWQTNTHWILLGFIIVGIFTSNKTIAWISGILYIIYMLQELSWQKYQKKKNKEVL